VKVQGKGAVEEIVSAFDWFNQAYREKKIELVVLTRGGGSLEDLQAFNSEEVARAVFSSKVPVVCGIGHERDESLVDFIADLRASTPSNAAELITRDRSDVRIEINGLIQNAEHQLRILFNEKKSFIDNFIINNARIISEQAYGINQVIASFFAHIRTLASIAAYKKQEINLTALSLKNNIESNLAFLKQAVDQQMALLKSYNPTDVLKRGYGIVQDKNGKIIKGIDNVRAGQQIKTLMRNGSFSSRVQIIKSNLRNL
jgi:exodeoxyribonuclease VII large subunit